MQKYIKYISLIFLSISLFSQEMDKSFLDSLPKDIQDDVLDRVDDNKSSDEPIYRSSSSASQLEKQNLQKLKERLEKDLEYLESVLNEDDEKDSSEKLELFGKDFFSTFQSSFMPINEPNLDSSYILDFGDAGNSASWPNKLYRRVYG